MTLATARARPNVIAYPEPELSTPLVRLRRWTRDDLRLVREASADPSLRLGTTLPERYTAEEGVAFIERQWSRAARDEGLSLAVEATETGRTVGCATLMLRRPGIADLGYWLVAGARGRGLGRAVVALVVPWSLDAMDVDAVEAFVHPDNEPSRRILDACGFALIGSRRHAVGRIDEELLVYRRDR